MEMLDGFIGFGFFLNAKYGAEFAEIKLSEESFAILEMQFESLHKGHDRREIEIFTPGADLLIKPMEMND